VVPEDRVDAVPRGEARQLGHPRLEVGRGRVDDVAGDADDVRLDREHAVDRLAERRAVRARSEVQVADVHDAQAGRVGRETGQLDGEPRDLETPLSADEPVDERPAVSTRTPSANTRKPGP
jgi:hypothetical protein